jgi:hypothetical protein
MSVPAPASTAEAMDMVLTGLRYMAAADPTALAAEAQAECLRALEQGDAISTAARAWFLCAFTTGQGYTEDADYSPTAWLIHHTRVTKGAARGHLGWVRRVMAHPQVAAALAEGTVLTESMAPPSVGGPTSYRGSAGPPPMRSWSPPPGPGPGERTCAPDQPDYRTKVASADTHNNSGNVPNGPETALWAALLNAGPDGVPITDLMAACGMGRPSDGRPPCRPRGDAQ